MLLNRSVQSVHGLQTLHLINSRTKWATPRAGGLLRPGFKGRSGSAMSVRKIGCQKLRVTVTRICMYRLIQIVCTSFFER